MKNKLYKWNMITAALVVVVIFISILSAVHNFLSMDSNVYDNDSRILVSNQKSEVEKGIYNAGRYPYIVFGLDGTVLYNDTALAYKKDDKVNVQEILQFDKSFKADNEGKIKKCFVLQKTGKAVGFVVFVIPQREVIVESNATRAWKVFLPILLGAVICILILIARTLYLNHRILKPLKEISSSSKAIIAGNYNLEVVRSYEKVIGENEVGELTYSFELMRDELKEKQVNEERLKKSQQELISCISHDLKTPISTIKAYSEGLRDGIAKTPEAQKDFVKIIISKTDLLIGMINELLEYSNTKLKQLDINLEEVYFLEYFEPVLKELEVYVKQKDMDFSYHIKTPDLIVSIDKKRITEVLYNLVENSMKYAGIKRGHIEVEAERQGDSVLIKVKDDGIGISPDDIPYVFDKFYRAEKSRSSSIPGSGLGLSICKYIVNEHGGEIYCKSRLNKGCEIGFTIH